LYISGTGSFHSETTGGAGEVVGNGEAALAGLSGLHIRLRAAQVYPTRSYGKLAPAM